MPLWISFALLAAAVATLLIRNPRGNAALGTHSPDLDVYRDQLDELQSDAERGVIDPGQAAAARAEIARRLLRQAAADAPAAHAGKPKHTVFAERLLMGSVAAVPVLGLLLYLAVGSPGLPGSPLAERLASPPNAAAPNDMIAKVEARLREKPDDGQGWAVIAPVYLSMGRAPDAANAFARAISLLGESPERLLGLAKANVMANNGMVNEPARKALQRLVEQDPERVEARFWLAVYDEQNGRPDAAASAYLALLSSGPADAPWRKAVEERLAAVTGKPGATPAPGVTPPVLAPAASGPDGKGPTPAQFVAAAQKLAPEMREQMIGRMVAKATDAVKANPQDLAAWSRIVTGHAALGKLPDAKTALKDARQTLSGNAAALTELDALAKSLELNS
ncbi:MAG: c-type cytochrome biogenesis protein CcmI [Hyphomicrobiaceae bacterium]